jgi:hypothetical protein
MLWPVTRCIFAICGMLKYGVPAIEAEAFGTAQCVDKAGATSGCAATAGVSVIVAAPAGGAASSDEKANVDESASTVLRTLKLGDVMVVAPP